MGFKKSMLKSPRFFGIVGMSLKALEVRDLVKYYDGFKALDGLSFDVGDGEIHGFLGPNGAGKTTTIRVLMGLLDSDGGEIRIYGESEDGRDFRTMSRIGYMPEMPSFPGHLTSEELLDIYGQIFCVSEEERVERAEELLGLVGLSNYADERIETFSKGMRQRLGIAQSLISDPDLLVLDEPTAGLDPGGRARIRNIVQDVGDRGITIFISSHLLEEVEKTCDHATIIHEGQCVMSGSVEEISNFHKGSELDMEIHGLDDDVVDAVELLSQVERVEREGEELRVFVRGVEDARIQVSKAITEAGGTIIGMSRRSRSLEEVFLEVTEGGSKDGQLR
ncbi:MAG: ABC transporter ATP-binding protein [Candidatus Hadarchaeota archaeon]